MAERPRYVVVQDDNLRDLEVQVNARFGEGYVPVGGVAVALSVYVFVQEPVERTVYLQTMQLPRATVEREAHRARR